MLVESTDTCGLKLFWVHFMLLRVLSMTSIGNSDACLFLLLTVKLTIMAIIPIRFDARVMLSQSFVALVLNSLCHVSFPVFPLPKLTSISCSCMLTPLKKMLSK